jgi:hypothetical protein
MQARAVSATTDISVSDIFIPGRQKKKKKKKKTVQQDPDAMRARTNERT